ncbi:MAG: hypothetical protein UR93_C0004G0001 [Berkelbacteria bacterium GW2011_GWA2_35_9]|uniref:Uncharacterized protein n=1 Tax=Berkelbacteria bacterium GW2011_GWA2_35_9 TaxID=1618333 RepID=A0A0G0D6U8_9BACT|nr:MAG: hypothetical protein UR93_C0004G0001 [Berkelbacteria bacterium GW2011_GWA2_35_9]
MSLTKQDLKRLEKLGLIVANMQTRLEVVEQKLSKIAESNKEDTTALYEETDLLKKRLKKLELKILALSHK